MNRRSRMVLIAAVVRMTVAAQEEPGLIGRYNDGFGHGAAFERTTELSLRKDSTFVLTRPDPVFTYNPGRYTSTGRWTMVGDTVLLDPELAPLSNVVRLHVLDAAVSDSVSISLSCSVREVSADRSSIEERPFEFQMVSLYFNDKHHVIHVRHRTQQRACLFTPRIKHQVIAGPGDMVRVERRRSLERVGFYTYGMDKVQWLEVPKGTSALRLEFVQEIDADRAPRQRRVVIEGERAYFHTRNGRIDRNLSSLLKY